MNDELLKRKENSAYEIRKTYNLHEPQRLEEAIDILEEWVKKQTHFLKHDYPRQFYESKLINSKGSVEKAKKGIDRMCTLRTLLPKLFTEANVKTEFQVLLKERGMIPLPNMTDHLYRVILFRFSSNDLIPYHYHQFYQYMIITCEYLMKHDFNLGFVVICDLRIVDIVSALSKMNLVEFQQILTVLMEGYGTRLKNIVLISGSKYIEMIVKILKQIFSKKIADRISIISDVEGLPTFVPREMLPKDYGGDELPFNEMKKKWLDVLSSEDHLEYMKVMNKAATDESRRTIDKFNENYVGMPGSFRTLTVD